jgi:hypothetical protein
MLSSVQDHALSTQIRACNPKYLMLLRKLHRRFRSRQREKKRERKRESACVCEREREKGRERYFLNPLTGLPTLVITRTIQHCS